MSNSSQPKTGGARTDTPSPTDEDSLVARLRAGDHDAYEDLLRIHGGRLLCVANRIMRDEEDARECLQEAFLSAFQRIRNFRGHSKLNTWLHRIVVNACLTRLRYRKRRHEDLAADQVSSRFDEYGIRIGESRASSATPAEMLQNQETRVQVREAIDRLPDGSRIVLLLRDVEELSTTETAVVLGCTPDAVRVRLHRARLALRSGIKNLFD